MVSPTNPLVTGYPSTMGDDVQLNTTTLIRHAARTHGDQEIVYRTADGTWDRYTFRDAYARISRCASALAALGVEPGTRVGILDWNSRRHFELYWAVPGLAAVMVQLNLRLGPEDLSFVVNDSGSSIVCVDESLLPIAEAVAPTLTGVTTWLVMTDKSWDEVETTLPNAHHFEDLLAAADPTFDWPEIDERSAYAACYTTGTTGRPKGVFYSHRSICLHAYALATSMRMSPDDCTMLITPMFHVQAWGLPQAATLTATKIVLPGRYGTDELSTLTDALIAEDVTVTNGAPAIFGPMLDHIRALPDKPNLRRLRMMSGASEPPLAMMKGYKELTGAEVLQVYGASETSPVVTVNWSKPSVRARLPEGDLVELRRKQGLPVPLVDFRLVDGDGKDVAWDGIAQGEICMRGPWVTTGYHKMPASETADRFIEGYWRSGDVGTIDPDGYLKVTDRLKDVVKSGGEWISSIDMENLLVSHPAVSQAAVVGLFHPKWQERPFVLVVPEPGYSVTLEELREHLSSAFATWQLPDAVQFVDEIPRTSVGKINKKVIRAEYDGYYGTDGDD